MFPTPKALGHFFPHISPCVGQEVSGWAPLELSTPPPPPPVGVGQVLWVPAKSGCLPFYSAPPPPRLPKKRLVGSAPNS